MLYEEHFGEKISREKVYEDGIKLIETLEGVECIYVTYDYELYITSGLDDIFVITDNAFKIAN
jgi:thiamine biosynthesis lipoprotein